MLIYNSGLNYSAMLEHAAKDTKEEIEEQEDFDVEDVLETFNPEQMKAHNMIVLMIMDLAGVTPKDIKARLEAAKKAAED